MGTSDTFRLIIEGRLQDLEDQLVYWKGQYSQGSRPGLAEALTYVEGYPAVARQKLAEVCDDAANTEVRSAELAKFSSRITRMSALARNWFDHAGSMDNVPVALHRAVSERFDELGLKEYSSIIVVGKPTTFECRVDNLKALVFDDWDAPDAVENFAIIEVPPHEGRSPKWWPVILGHELGHLLLRQKPKTRRAIANALQLQYREEMLHESSQALGGLGKSTEGDAVMRGLNESELLGIAKHWSYEHMCDLMSVHSYGPAAIAALDSHLWSLNHFTVVSLTHPPGWLRHKLMCEYLGNQGGLWRDLVSAWGLDSIQEEEEKDALDETSRGAIKLIEGIATTLNREVKDLLDKPQYSPGEPSHTLSINLARDQLQLGIPPFPAHRAAFPKNPRSGTPVSNSADGEVEGGSNGMSDAKSPTEISLADLLNACWIEDLAEREAADPESMTRLPIENLTLKAIELMQLATELDAGKFVTGGAPDISALTGDGHGAVLGGEAIKSALENKEWWRRLIVVPRFSEAVGSGSMDLRLGNRFIVFQRTATASFSAARSQDSRSVQRSVECNWREPFVLHPGELVLASVLEYVVMPVDLSAQVITRSSYGRLGLITATAVQVHPNYRGCLTLELVNLGTVPLELYPGEPIAQLVFFSTQVQDANLQPMRKALLSGKYVCPTGPQFPVIKVDDWILPTVRDHGERNGERS